jgi:hypothetical protein
MIPHAATPSGLEVYLMQLLPRGLRYSQRNSNVIPSSSSFGAWDVSHAVTPSGLEILKEFNISCSYSFGA